MKYNPHNYQKYATEFIMSHPVAAVILQMGLGKTVCTLDAIEQLMYERFEIRKVLVIAPLRVAKVTWSDEIKKWDFDEIKKYKDSKSKLRKSKKFKDDNYKQFAFGTIEKKSSEIDYFYEKNDFDDKDLRFYFEIDRYNTFEEAMDALKEYKKELFDAKSFGSIVGLYISREEKIIYMENFESFEIYKPVEIYPENKFRKDSKIKNNLSQNKKFNN